MSKKTSKLKDFIVILDEVGKMIAIELKHEMGCGIVKDLTTSPHIEVLSYVAASKEKDAIDYTKIINPGRRV